MVTPAQRRELAAWGISAYQVPERRSCSVFGVCRSTLRYKSRKPSQEPLRQRLRELAAARVHAGYQQLHVYLRREGWAVNHKRVLRLYREEGLSLRQKKPRRRRSAARREGRPAPQAPNELWAMDFMHDTLASGRAMRVLTAIDVYTWECLALEPAPAFSGADVAKIMHAASVERGKLPARIKVDNGTEFTSKSLDAWAYWNQLELDFSRPGKPGDNARIEAFNSIVRRECLSQHWFLSIEDARRILDEWRKEYNEVRPHGGLGREVPARYRAGTSKNSSRIEARKSQS
jgi:putative transposase